MKCHYNEGKNLSIISRELSISQDKHALTLARVLQDAEVARVYELARTFVDIVRYKRPDEFDGWLEVCTASSVKAMRTFAAGIQQDYKAVRSALGLP